MTIWGGHLGGMRTKKGLAFFAIIAIFNFGCLPNVSNNIRTKPNNSTDTAAKAKVGQGYVLKDNPIILSGISNLNPEINLNRYVSVANITTEAFLIGQNYCYGTNDTGYCFEVRAKNTDTFPLQTANGIWGYDAHTSEFLEVNSFYHVNKILTQFFTDLNTSYGLAFSGSTNIMDSALPLGIMQLNGQYQFAISDPLKVYADCDKENNANFDSAKNALCFGYFSNSTKMRWAQDSSAIYHEAGHFLQYLLLNLNNSAFTIKPRLGNYNYDEAGAIGEGLSDFFSYYVNERTHFSEWAAGRTLNASRPISEDDSLHVPVLAKESGRRLAYPDYLDYNPNSSTIPTEDIHYSGMIISHFLVAFTEDIEDKCALSKRDAITYTFSFIAETLAEMGDLNSKGTYNNSIGAINNTPSYAYDWLMKVNPVNFRTFSQTFAKNVIRSLSNSSFNRCNGSIYAQDNLETLLDDYGLLLFRTYNEYRNYANYADSSKRNTAITATNRNKSVLISKNLIKLDPTTNAASAYIIDKQSLIAQGLAAYKASGLITQTSDSIPPDLPYNNDNNRASPGEIVGIALNLYNDSNSTMGGIQILANDWKNLGPNGKPCIYSSVYSNDYNWTTTAEGGEPCGPDASPPSTISASSATDFQPICVMQYRGTSSTSWVSQKVFRNKLSLDTNFCLNKDDDRDCFIRAIKGADQSYYSKINPKKTWLQSMQNPESSKAYGLDWSNIILFEISKQVPPGTTVDCRFRVRFTNCEDCYHDAARNNYDYKDENYNGPTPYKIIHLQMNITD